MLRPEVDIKARREAEGINIDRGLQQMLNTENPWLNVIITHSKFISSPFISLFSTIIPIFLPSFLLLYTDDTGKPTFGISIRISRRSVSESRVLKSTGKSIGFFVILTGDSLTYRNALHKHIST